MCHKWEKRVDIGSSKNLPRLLKKQELVKDFSALLLLAFGAGSFCAVGVVLCREGHLATTLPVTTRRQ